MPEAFIVGLQLCQSRCWCIGNVAGLEFCSLGAKFRSKLCRPMRQRHPRAQAGYKWLSLLHVRRVLIPALNELANGRPFPLTRFPHTFTHQALVAWPTGPSESWGSVRPALNLRALPLSLVFFSFFLFFFSSCTTDVPAC